jgi:hypothetical protein
VVQAQLQIQEQLTLEVAEEEVVVNQDQVQAVPAVKA